MVARALGRPWRFSAVVAACVLSAHCAAPQPPSTERIGSLSEIAGQWDIVSFDGYRPRRLDNDGQRHAFVDVTGSGGLAFAIECNYSGMAGRIDDAGRLVETSSESITTAMGCAPERERRDTALFQFLRAAPTVARSGDDLIFATDTSRLVLQRPDLRRAPALPRTLDEIEGRWTAPIIYFESAPGTNRNLIAWLDGAPARVEFSAGAARLSFDCETAEAETSLAAPGSLRFSAPRRRLQSTCRIPEGDRDLAASLLAGAAEVERIDANRMHLVNGPVRAVLER